MTNVFQQWRWTGWWCGAVVILSLPSVAFVCCHAVSGVRWPDWLEATLAWSMVLTSMFGVLSTLAAFLVAVAGTLQRSVSAKTKVVMWCVVTVSLLAILYMAQVRP